MIRDLVGSLDTGMLSTIGLIAFMVAFAAILAYTFTLRRSDRDAAKRLPLEDHEEIVFNRN